MRMVLHVETVSFVATHEGSALRSSSISGVESSMKWPTTMASIDSLVAASIQKWKAEGVVPLQNWRMYVSSDSGAGPLMPLPIDLFTVRQNKTKMSRPQRTTNTFSSSDNMGT